MVNTDFKNPPVNSNITSTPTPLNQAKEDKNNTIPVPQAPPKVYLSLKNRMIKWLKESKNSISNFFYRIFSCCKKPAPKLIAQQTPIKPKTIRRTRRKLPVQQNPEIKKVDLIQTRLVNGEGLKTCREILKGIGADINLSPVQAPANQLGKILVPLVYAKDLYRTSQVFMNGRKIFDIKNNGIEKVEECCNELIKALGDKVFLAAVRLLNQAAFSTAYIHLLAEKSKESMLLKQLDMSQYDIEIEGDKVHLKTKFAFECVVEPGSPTKKEPEFFGIESKYTVSLKELSDLGTLTLDQLRDLELNQVAPTAEAVYSYTKGCKTPEEAMQGIGIDF